MTKTFDFELVSPERKLISEPAWQVSIPGEEGVFGVRAQHTSLVASVKPGVVEIWKQEGDKPQRIFVAGGFADVSATNCSVLAEEAIAVEDLDKSKLEQDLSNLNDDLKMADDKVAQNRIKTQIAITKAKINALDT